MQPGTTVDGILFCYIVALVCFFIALLIAVSKFNGNYDAWLAGGLLAFVAARLIAWRA